MSKYKVGDKFIVEIKAVAKDGTYEVQEGHWFVESIFNSMHKIDSNMKIEDITDMIAEYETEKKGYNRGLADAWELAKKLYNFTCNKLEDIYGVDGGFYELIRDYAPQEALRILEAYEKSQQIQIGDVVVVKSDDRQKFVVTYIFEDRGKVAGTRYDGMQVEFDIDAVIKTGKHFDIEHLLEQIRGNE